MSADDSKSRATLRKTLSFSPTSALSGICLKRTSRPAFFFDGEQAQKLIENMGEAGIKKAVEVMFGTKVIGELAETIGNYL